MNTKTRGTLIVLLGLAVIAAGLGTNQLTAAGPVAQDSGPSTSIPYQGRLTGDDGRPVAEGTMDFIFEIYAAQNDGKPLWTETQTGVPVRDGYFSVLLGGLSPLSVEAARAEHYLAVSVRGPGDADFTTLEPRQSLEDFLVRPAQTTCGATADHDHWLDAWTGDPPPGFDIPWTGLRVYGSSMDARLVYHYEDLATSWDSGVYGESTGSKGTGVRGVGSSYGVHGEGSYGVFGISEQTDGVGVYGYVNATSGTNWGVYGLSDSTTGRGVYGRAGADSGTTYGVYGVSTSTTGRGVFGDNNSETGLNYGVRGESSSNEGRGVFGGAYATSGTTYGVYGYTASTAGRGVYGYASADSGTTYGVYGLSDSTTGRGVFGDNNSETGLNYGVRGESSSNEGRGVFGGAYATSGTTYGVRGENSSSDGRGVYGYADAASGGRIGVGGSVNGSGYGLYTTDSIYSGAGCVGCTLAFIARNTSGETLKVGDVVAASGVGATLQGHTAPVLEVRRAVASDPSVLGVVYMRGELYRATGDAPQDSGDTVQPVAGEVAPGDYVLIVTSGLAQVRVAPTLTSLTPGQSLTVGAGAGEATLSSAHASPSLVFGRAMEAQPDESGLVWAMISLP